MNIKSEDANALNQFSLFVAKCELFQIYSPRSDFKKFKGVELAE